MKIRNACVAGSLVALGLLGGSLPADADDACLTAPKTSEAGCRSDLKILTDLLKKFNQLFDEQQIASSSTPCTLLRKSGIQGTANIWINMLSTQDNRTCLARHVQDNLDSICATSGGGACVSSVLPARIWLLEAAASCFVPNANAIGAIIAHEELCKTKPRKVIAETRVWLSQYLARLTATPECIAASSKPSSVEDKAGAAVKDGARGEAAAGAVKSDGLKTDVK